MKILVEPVKQLGMAVMRQAGLGLEDCEIFVDSLLYADRRGIGSHGISRLRTYAKRVALGVVSVDGKPEILRESPALLLVDGNNGMGAPTALRVMDMCISRAHQNGCCFAGVRNANHFGTGAYFTQYAARQTMIGFAAGNSEAVVVPTGGAKAMLGTNPLSVAVPAGRYNSLVLDMATSVVARGKVVLAQKEGKPIPQGWCVDFCGAPTTDPAAALEGAMLPFGGAKGYSISLIIDLLCSALTGSLNCRETHHFWDDFEHPQNVGYFIGAMDVSKMLPVESFADSVDGIFDEFKGCPTAPGVKEVMIPGEIEDRKMEETARNGIELSGAVIRDLIDVAQQYGVKHPFGEFTE